MTTGDGGTVSRKQQDAEDAYGAPNGNDNWSLTVQYGAGDSRRHASNARGMLLLERANESAGTREAQLGTQESVRRIESL